MLLAWLIVAVIISIILLPLPFSVDIIIISNIFIIVIINDIARKNYMAL